MWSYYGAKTNVINHYPTPKFDMIIEPFAGTARYALKYFEKDILLVDKYKVITDIWQWLQLCSEQDILRLPRRMKAGETLEDYTFDCAEAKLLMGFLVGYGLEKPRVTATNKQLHRPNFINYSLIRISKSLFKIRHWKIINGSYEDIDNKEATWFIDPPYQNGGACYPCSSNDINFDHLTNWATSRNGQIIICESMKATWLDFKPLAIHKGRTGMQKEGIWTNQHSAFDNIQLKLL
jgi:hypothetical protein